MTDSNSNLVIDMEYEDHDFSGGTPPGVQIDRNQEPDPVVPPNSVVPPIPGNIPEPVTVEPSNFEGTPIAAFSMALKVLEPFNTLEIDKAASVEEILPKIEDQWNKALQAREAGILKKYEDIAGEITLLQSGRPDAIAQLSPLKQIAILPIQATQDVTEEQAEENRKQLIISMYTQLRNNTMEEAETLYDIVKSKGGDTELALKAAKDFGTMYVQSIQQIKYQEDARQAAEKQAFEDKQKAINDSIKSYLTSKKLLGLDITDDDVTELENAIHGDAAYTYKVIDDSGKEVDKVGTRAEMFFDIFDQNPELQLAVLHRYIKGDFNKVNVRDKRAHVINTQIADVLNKRTQPAIDNANYIDIT